MSAPRHGIRKLTTLLGTHTWCKRISFVPSVLPYQYSTGAIVSSIGPTPSNNETSTAITAQSVSEKLADDTEAVMMIVPPELGYTPKDIVIWMVEYIHGIVGLEYWASIVAVTLTLRFFMLPLAIKTQKNTVAMACVRPEAEKIQEAYKKHPKYETDHQLKMQMAEEMKALWKKYDVNPFRALALPAVQLPIFISFFLAMRDMPSMYSDMSKGGLFWFSDLAAADSTMILPIINGLSFLAMVEMGSDGMAANQASTMKTVMRVLAVVMVPATMHFNSGLFVYWGANNIFSIVQTGVMKLPLVREALNIRSMPIPELTPELKLANSVNPVKLYVDKLHMKVEQDREAQIEIIDGVRRTPPPPLTPIFGVGNEKSPSFSEPKVVTFSNAKKKKKG